LQESAEEAAAIAASQYLECGIHRSAQFLEVQGFETTTIWDLTALQK